MQNTEKLPRTVGFWGAALFPINGMIGSGIFALPAILVAAVGNFAPWMMLFGALLILPLTLVFATLATRFDSHGGPVLYAHEAFGSFAGFQSGWMRYASGVVAIAANTHVAVAYLAAIFPILDSPMIRSVTVIGFILFTMIINLIGMRSSVRALGVMTAIKIAPLLIFIILGLATHNPAIGFKLPQFSEFESVVLLTFYAFTAFENGTFAAGELHNPKKNVPLALMTTLSAVALFYMLVIWAYLAINPQVSGDSSALAAAAEVLAGQTGVIIISLAAAFSIGANTLSGGIVTPRMTFGMAEKGTLPKAFAHISPKYKTPDFSILFYSGFAIVFSLWAGFATLAVASTLSRLVMYLLSALALPVLNKNDTENSRKWHLPIALLASASAIWVASHASSQAYQMLTLIFIVGTALYFIAVNNHKK